MSKKQNETEIQVPKDLVTVPKAAEILLCKAHTLDQQRCECKGPPYYRIGGTIFYSIAELHQYIKDCRVVPGEDR